MTDDILLRAILADPLDTTAWLALADWLEEVGQDRRAHLLRLRERLLSDPESPDHPSSQSAMQTLLLSGVAPVAALWTLDLGGVPLALSLIPPGNFLMGSPPSEADHYENEHPRHRVSISHPFYIGQFPVTQTQWQTVMGHNPSSHPGRNLPVETVNWHECGEFCARISRIAGRPCRLPFEAEWEYACRAGTSTAFNTGDGPDAMKRAGWCSPPGQPGSVGRPCPVGGHVPNAFGLYDMHGNVREWCADELRTYEDAPCRDPRGGQGDFQRAVRGGSWYYSCEDCRSACRYARPMDYRLDYYGLRVVVECE